MLLLLPSCAALPAGTDPVIKIGLVAPFEGRHRQVGYDLIYAARLAVREWNGRGGVEGHKIELVALDDSGDPEMAVRAAQSLVGDPDVLGVIGHWRSEATEAARPVYAKAGLAFIATDESNQQRPPLPADFVAGYKEVAPFGETPGSYALPAYDACQQLIGAIGQAIETDGKPGRAGVAAVISP